MSLSAGRLRHRIQIQQRVAVRDPVTGAEEFTWQTIAGMESVPAAVEPLSVREFMAAQATQSQTVARVVIRHRPGLDATMRILHGAKVYNPQGWLADMDSGLEYLTAPVTAGVNDG